MKSGFRVRYVAKLLGLPFTVEMEVHDFVPGQGWVARSVGGPQEEGTWRFSSENGHTRFTYRLSYRMPPAVLGPLLDRWLMARRWEDAITLSLAALKRLLEQPGR